MTKPASDHRGPARRALFLCSAVVVSGCAPLPPVFPPIDPPLVWPSSGEVVRFRYVGSLSSEADLKRRLSFWEWIGAIWGGEEPPAEIGIASDVAFDTAGIVYVADPGSQVVHRFDLENREYSAFRDAGNGQTLLTPMGITMVGEDVLVADRSLGAVVRLTSSGEPRALIGAGGLQGPVGLCVGPISGRIYVADVASHHVFVFGPDGRSLFALGGRGEGPGEFNFPTYVACDREENLYVTDTLNCRVQAFDQHGTWLRSWGMRGNSAGEFSRPKDIACDSGGRVYVVDSHFENIQIFTPTGEFLLALGGEGNGPGQFWLPIGIFIDENDTIWVGDSYNRRIQVFQYLDQSETREVAP